MGVVGISKCMLLDATEGWHTDKSETYGLRG